VGFGAVVVEAGVEALEGFRVVKPQDGTSHNRASTWPPLAFLRGREASSFDRLVSRFQWFLFSTKEASGGF
jgi:hypothetical protein